ncbi:MAG: Flp pilus assembly protein CpaB [Verrucomicrobiia bacterium]
MAKTMAGGRILMVGVVLGLASTILLYVYLRRQTQSYKANWKTVVVAAMEIPARTKITREKIVIFTTPPELISPGAIQDRRMVEGKLARTTIHSAAQITAADLMVEGEIPGLAVRVPPGKRAIAIAASEIIAVGGMIKPGDYVDVLGTYRDPDGKIEITQMILQNAPVLAVNVGQTESSTPEGAKTSMTLAVAPEDTERLTAAAVAGQLRVSLRSPADTEVIRTAGVTVREIPVGRMRGEAEVHAPVPAVAPPAPPVQEYRPRLREITIIRGTEGQIVVQ